MRRLLPAARAAADPKNRSAVGAVSPPRAAGAVAVALLAALGLACVAAPTALAQERTYELVTPTDNTARVQVPNAMASEDGDVIYFSSAESMAGAIPNGPFPAMDSFVSRRSPAEWTTEWANPTDDLPGTVGSNTMFIGADGSRQVFGSESVFASGDLPNHSMDSFIGTPDGVIWASGPTREPGVELRYPNATDAGVTRVLFTAGQPLVPEDQNTTADVYLGGANGVKLLSPGVDYRSGEVNGSMNIPRLGSSYRAVQGALSGDAQRAYFHTDAAILPADTDTSADVYVNDHGTIKLVSGHERPSPPPADQPATMLAGARDGDRACFATATQLTVDDVDTVADLYCRRLSTDVLERVSVGASDGDANAAAGLAVSGDGSTVFMSTASVLSGEDADGGPSLYRHVEGEPAAEYLAPLAPLDAAFPQRVATATAHWRALKVRDDGELAAFVSNAQIVPEDTDSNADVYRWTEGGGMELISRGPVGGDGPVDAVAGAFVLPSFPGDLNPFTYNEVMGRWWARDGASIFFETAERLVPRDVDGGKRDVYEWREGEGVRLVTPGADASDAYYLDNSVDGDTLFFATTESIVSADVNNGVQDVYAARAGGGFPVPDPADGCDGVGCLGAYPGRPRLAEPSSQEVDGEGNLGRANRGASVRAVALGRLGARQRARLARRGRVAYRVRVGGRGRVRVIARGRLAGKRRVLARGARRARGAGLVRVPVRLTRPARRHLARGGRLRLTVVARAGRARDRGRLTLTSRRSGSARRGGR